VTASNGVDELAGNFFPACVQGTIRAERAGTTLLRASVQHPAVQPSNGAPYVYAGLLITAAFGLGSLDVTFDLSCDEGKYGVGHGSRSAGFSVVL
jgi:hypothetical protein